MTLSEPAIRPNGSALLAPPPAGAPLATPTAAARPTYDASPAAYRRLRRKIVEAGLLNRRYDYYLGRTLVSFAILAAGLGLLFTLPSGWVWTVLAASVMGVGLAQVAMIGHDCGHLQVFKKADTNCLLGQLCFSLVVGVGFWSWKERHNTHHVETNDEEEDPDLSFGGFFTLNEADAAARTGLSKLIVRYQAWLFVPVVTTMLSVVMRGEGWRYAVQDLSGSRRVVELVVLALNAVIWLTPTIWLGWWWLGAFAVANMIGGLYLGMTIAPNHKGMPTWAHGTQLSFLERQVIGSRNILPGPIAEFAFGGLNYQIEHHLFPNMPRANLGKCHDIVRPFCQQQGIPYEEVSVWESYRQTFAAFDRCGRATR
ncbi:MAG: acyl-CoA desaturase [Chloroflexi bacterium]|nr:acyl-CoA desaturase [Chloroflexota bacterium]